MQRLMGVVRHFDQSISGSRIGLSTFSWERRPGRERVALSGPIGSDRPVDERTRLSKRIGGGEMANARITRLRKIGDYRVFQSWTDEGRAIDLARVNLIYEPTAAVRALSRISFVPAPARSPGRSELESSSTRRSRESKLL